MMGNIRKLSGNFRIFSYLEKWSLGGFWEIIGEKNEKFGERWRKLEKGKDMVNKKIC